MIKYHNIQKDIFKTKLINKNLYYQTLNINFYEKILLKKFTNKIINRQTYSLPSETVHNKILTNINNSNFIKNSNSIKNAILIYHTGSQDYSWQHFMQDFVYILPKVLNNFNNYPIILDKRIKKISDYVLKEILKINNEIIYIERNSVFVENLFLFTLFPFSNVNNHNIPSYLRTDIQKYFLDYFHQKQDKLLYLTRNNCRYRKVLNEDVLINYLKKYSNENNLDFKIFKSEELEINERFKLFNQSKIIIAPHGGAIFHMYACYPKTKFIEFVNSNGALSCSSISIAPFLNLEHLVLFNNGSHKSLGYHIDLNLLDDILNEKNIENYEFDLGNNIEISNDF